MAENSGGHHKAVSMADEYRTFELQLKAMLQHAAMAHPQQPSPTAARADRELQRSQASFKLHSHITDEPRAHSGPRCHLPEVHGPFCTCAWKVGGMPQARSAPVPREDVHHAEPYMDLPIKNFSHQLSRKRSKSSQRFAAPANSAEGSAENFLPGSNSLLSGDMDIAFLEASPVGDTDGTSAPPPSAALQLQVWPEPVFRTPLAAPAECPALVMACSNSNTDNASEGAASSAGMSRTLGLPGGGRCSSRKSGA